MPNGWKILLFPLNPWDPSVIGGIDIAILDSTLDPLDVVAIIIDGEFAWFCRFWDWFGNPCDCPVSAGI